MLNFRDYILFSPENLDDTSSKLVLAKFGQQDGCVDVLFVSYHLGDSQLKSLHNSGQLSHLLRPHNALTGISDYTCMQKESSIPGLRKKTLH